MGVKVMEFHLKDSILRFFESQPVDRPIMYMFEVFRWLKKKFAFLSCLQSVHEFDYHVQRKKENESSQTEIFVNRIVLYCMVYIVLYGGTFM